MSLSSDVFCCVIPTGSNQDELISDLLQHRRFIPRQATTGDLPLQSIRRADRGTTEDVEESDIRSRTLSQAHLELRFSDIPKTQSGVISGSGEDCDVVLMYPGVSAHHFAIGFDKYSRLVLQDLGSKHGTSVQYSFDDDKRLFQTGGQFALRRSFTWIINAHHSFQQGIEVTLLTKGTDIRFCILTLMPDYSAPIYVDRIVAFRAGTAPVAELLEGLDATSETHTAPISAIHTPSSQPIHVAKLIGRGGFAEVFYQWNVSTGEETVLKRPIASTKRKRNVNYELWEREASLLKRLNHRHIVALRDSTMHPEPKLYLEYVGGGTLAEQDDLTEADCTQVLQQGLSALTYLHVELGIAHRDIKPENILVNRRDDDGIDIKLCDFGLAKDNAYFSTFCGTKLYLAPEIYRNNFLTKTGKLGRMTYSCSVDIWSLGVTVFSLFCDLPKVEPSIFSENDRWCELVRETFVADHLRKPTPLKSLLLVAMIVLDERWSAKECYEKAVLLPGRGAKDSNTRETSTSATSSSDLLEQSVRTSAIASSNDSAANTVVLVEVLTATRPSQGDTTSVPEAATSGDHSSDEGI